MNNSQNNLKIAENSVKSIINNTQQKQRDLNIIKKLNLSNSTLQKLLKVGKYSFNITKLAKESLEDHDSTTQRQNRTDNNNFSLTKINKLAKDKYIIIPTPTISAKGQKYIPCKLTIKFKDLISNYLKHHKNNYHSVIIRNKKKPVASLKKQVLVNFKNLKMVHYAAKQQFLSKYTPMRQHVHYKLTRPKITAKGFKILKNIYFSHLHNFVFSLKENQIRYCGTQHGLYHNYFPNMNDDLAINFYWLYRLVACNLINISIDPNEKRIFIINLTHDGVKFVSDILLASYSPINYDSIIKECRVYNLKTINLKNLRYLCPIINWRNFLLF